MTDAAGRDRCRSSASRGLIKRYGDVRAVDGIDFEVGPGEVFGLLGPNGAGKTTTVEILEGLREPDGGEVDASSASTSRRAPTRSSRGSGSASRPRRCTRS